MIHKQRPLIAVSACLLGSHVRYDNNHCQEQWIVEELSKFVDFYPLCPEMEMGLGSPREEIHLYYDKDNKSDIKLRTKFTRKELTSLAETTYSMMNEKMGQLQIDGFILTRKSPTCGLAHVKTVNGEDSTEVIHAQGLFARNICQKHPSVPKIDNGRLKNLELREHFIKSVFAHFRFNNLDLSIAELQDFHQRYKYILMEHSPRELKLLGKLVANSEKIAPEKVHLQYYQDFFRTLTIEASVKTRYDTFLHLMGYFKKNLTSSEKQELLAVFAEFREGILSYITPQRFFKFLTKKYNQKYLDQQYFFDPYPKEMKIQKHI